MKLTDPAAPGRPGSARFPFTLPGVVLIVAIYALVHALTRLLSSGNLGEDDTLDNLLIQSLAPGYSPHYGPLYDWLLWSLQQLFGTGIHAFLTLKYTLLVVMAGCIFLITRRITGSPLWAFIAVESMATVYQIFWRFHEGFTHRIGAMVLAVATFWAILRLFDNANWRNYLLFATMLGLGLLSEPTYGFFLLSLLAAASLQPGLRRQVFSARMLAALPVTLLITAPYLLWLLADPQRGQHLLADFYPIRPAATLSGLWRSLRDAATLPFLVLAPYVVIVPLVFPGLLKAARQSLALRPAPADRPDPVRLLTHLLLIEYGGLIVAGLLFSRSSYAVHSVLPMFAIALVWITEKIRQSAPTPYRIKVFMIVLMAFTATAYVVRSGNLFVYEPFCSRCRWAIPYEDLAGRLREQGFREGTVITDDERISGNLRRFFPDARFTLPGDGIELSGNGQIAVVWAANGEDTAIPAGLQQRLNGLAIPAQPTLIRSPWQHLWKPAGYRYSTWAAVVVDAPTRAAE